jgi:hypothetical protein
MHNVISILQSLSPETLTLLYDMNKAEIQKKFNLSDDEASTIYQVVALLHELDLGTK